MRMTDTDALVYELTEMVRHSTGEYKYGIEAARLVVMEAPTVGEWISVKDRLPERKWIDYLVATKLRTDGSRGFNIAWLNDDNGVWKSNDEWICDGREIVTHWRPLPPLPKEEA